MAKGKVKWWNDSKGYGFIQMPLHNPSGLETASRDVFAHFTNISGEGFKTLTEGETVEFDLYEDAKGPTAKNIQRKGIE